MNTPLFARIVFGLVCLASLFGPAMNAPAADKEKAQNVVVHLSHFTDDLHRSFMAVKLAGLMQKSGANVHLFLDIEGVRLADKRNSLDMTWGPSKTPLSEHYEAFVNAGGKVVLCPHCAHAGGVDDKNLARGASILNEEKMTMMLLDAEKLLDY
jgi:predicted peroxiredoxin